MNRKIFGGLLATLAVAALLFLLGFAWFVSGQLIHSPVAERPDECAAGNPDCEETVLRELALQPESLEITSFDGTPISVLFLPSRNGATVLMLHGFWGGRVYELEAAKRLQAHGFGALLVDMRGRGHSGGDWVTLGRDDARDLSAVLDYVIAERNVDPDRIGVMGVSHGGAMAILFAAKDRRVKAVIAASPYDAMNAATLAAFTELPFPLPWLVAACMEARLGVDLDEIAPLAVINAISPRAVFILEAGNDSVLVPDSGRRLYEAAAEPRRFWHEPGIEHGEFRYARPARFEQEVLAFFNEYLLHQEPLSE